MALFPIALTPTTPGGAHVAAAHVEVHVRVAYSCKVSNDGKACKGAAGDPPAKVIVRPGMVTYEF